MWVALAFTEELWEPGLIWAELPGCPSKQIERTWGQSKGSCLINCPPSLHDWWPHKKATPPQKGEGEEESRRERGRDEAPLSTNLVQTRANLLPSA